MNNSNHILSLKKVSKYFGNVIALKEVVLQLCRGEVHCLLGDNGAGKSTLIKTLAGVYLPSEGQYLFEGKEVRFQSPKDALDHGIATVYQDLALVPLMSVARNFFLGRELMKRHFGFFSGMDILQSAKIAQERLAEMGIHVRDPHQPVGNMSGGEKQCLAIARAIYFGARVLILDEPTAALGVKQSCNVLKLIQCARERGISVIFITHNVHHAYPIGDSFTLLNRGSSQGTYTKETITKGKLLDLMAGGEEMHKFSAELTGVAI